MKTRAYCNGNLLGEHTGMFSGSILISRHLKKGANFIAVFVSMEKIPASVLPMGEAVTVKPHGLEGAQPEQRDVGPFTSGFDNRSYDLHGIWQPVRLRRSGLGENLMTFGSRRHWMALMYRLRPVQPREAKRDCLMRSGPISRPAKFLREETRGGNWGSTQGAQPLEA